MVGPNSHSVYTNYDGEDQWRYPEKVKKVIIIVTQWPSSEWYDMKTKVSAITTSRKKGTPFFVIKVFGLFT